MILMRILIYGAAALKRICISVLRHYAKLRIKQQKNPQNNR